MITELILQVLLQIISTLGYLGVFILMTAESTFLPVPSEGVLPFAGYLISQGKFDFFITLIIATLGTVCGALLSYYIGKYLGKGFILKYGEYFFISKKELDLAHEWFSTKGEKTIFVCRFIPVIRHLISLPAGAAEMKRRTFVTYTILGGGTWNAILLLLGIWLEKNWETIIQYTQILDLFIILGIIFGIIYLVFLKKQKEK
ncbi:MAG: DedA family protein [archaeon]|jgi:membrane protein DedA with SNARE-associated domain